jgi:anti-sigma factor RsiW
LIYSNPLPQQPHLLLITTCRREEEVEEEVEVEVKPEAAAAVEASIIRTNMAAVAEVAVVDEGIRTTNLLPQDLRMEEDPTPICKKLCNDWMGNRMAPITIWTRLRLEGG